MAKQRVNISLEPREIRRLGIIAGRNNRSRSQQIAWWIKNHSNAGTKAAGAALSSASVAKSGSADNAGLVKNTALWLIVVLSLLLLMCSLALMSNLQDSAYIALDAPESVAPVPVTIIPISPIDDITAQGEDGKTYFRVYANDQATTDQYVLISGLFVVETQLEGYPEPVRLVRSVEVSVPLMPKMAFASSPVAFQVEDLWKIRADVVTGTGRTYEFVQDGWEDFDPARKSRFH